MNVIKAYKSLAFPCFPTFSDRNVIKGRPLPPTWPAAVPRWLKVEEVTSKGSRQLGWGGTFEKKIYI